MTSYLLIGFVLGFLVGKFSISRRLTRVLELLPDSDRIRIKHLLLKSPNDFGTEGDPRWYDSQ